MKMEVKFKKTNPKAHIPTKAHVSDAGFDLYATTIDYDDDCNIVYGTGLAFEIPEGHVGLLFPRSSNAKKALLLSNSVGVVDSGYRGEVLFKFKPTQHFTEHPEKVYAIGDRIGQMIIVPYPEIEFKEETELSSTKRGNGGYGSSGK